MEKNSRTEMLPGKRYFYRCCKARRSASHVNKEFWQLEKITRSREKITKSRRGIWADIPWYAYREILL